MSDQDQQAAVIAWAKHHDSRVDPSNPNSFASGAALFEDHGAPVVYCEQSGHSGDHLNNPSPS